MRAGDLFLRFGILALALHLIAVSGLAQETDAPSPAAPDGTTNSKTDGNSYSLSGTVINATTGEPVRRAAVQISGQSASVTITDAGGHFVIEGLAEGNVFLKPMKPGFYEDEGSHTSSARVGKDAPAVVLKLTPSGVISGHVNTKDGQPLEGFQIRLLVQQNVGGRLIWMDQPNQAQTNEEGEFRVVLQAGTYYVAVDQSTATTLSQKGVPNAREQTFAKVFYPGVSDLASATPIEIAPGQDAEANFTMSPELIYQVSGTLSGPSSAVTGLMFSRKAGDDSDFTQAADLQDGKFQVKVPAGAYSVCGTMGGGVELTTPGAIVMIRSDEADLQVPLSAAATIPVEIQKEQGAAGSERRVPVPGGLPGVFLQLMPLSQFRRGRTNFWGGQAGGIPNVAPGAYRLGINMSGEWWVKSARSGSVDLLSDDLTVPEGGQPEPIEVILRDGAGMLTGTVTPAGDPGRVLVLLVQPHGPRNIIHAVRAMQGNFAIPGIPPGDYAILALDGGDRLEYADPEILNPYLSDAEHVTVRPHTTVTVNLGLTSVKR